VASQSWLALGFKPIPSFVRDFQSSPFTSHFYRERATLPLWQSWSYWLDEDGRQRRLSPCIFEIA
jgi:hypothetical protein